VTPTFIIVDRDGEEIWPFRYLDYDDAEDVAREITRSNRWAEVVELQKGKRKKE